MWRLIAAALIVVASLVFVVSLNTTRIIHQRNEARYHGFNEGSNVAMAYATCIIQERLPAFLEYGLNPAEFSRELFAAREAILAARDPCPVIWITVARLHRESL